MDQYDELEQLLFRGFLAMPADLGGVPVVFKTINTFEFKLFDLYVPFNASKEEKRRYRTAYQIAYSVFLFNRVNVLNDREEYIPRLVDLFLDLPEKICTKILIHLKYLNKKSTEILENKVQPYTYGFVSRQYWSSYKGNPLNDPRFTGIKGTETLGLNMHQKIWTFLNRMEDDQEEYDRHWGLAKFQASVHNHKGIKKLDAKDRDNRRKRNREREQAFKSGGEYKIDRSSSDEIKVSNESVDDLLDQMKRSLKGQKDFHDQVVSQHERKVREDYMREQEKREQAQEHARSQKRERMASSDISEDPFIFYDEEEVKEKVVNQKTRKMQHLKEGNYRKDRGWAERSKRLKKWGIIKEENKARRDPNLPSGPNNGMKTNTIMDDYYQVATEDLSNPDSLNYPDIYDDEGGGGGSSGNK